MNNNAHNKEQNNNIINLNSQDSLLNQQKTLNHREFDNID